MKIIDFGAGDQVCWKSQAGGSEKVKVGVVMKIIRAGSQPPRDEFPALYKGAGIGTGRSSASYVVRVGKELYWPIASKLELVARAGSWAEPVPPAVGDQVSWKGQADFSDKPKVGLVVRVIPPGCHPPREEFPAMYKGVGVGAGRSVESYVVKVGTKLYWPVSSKLAIVARAGAGS